MAPLIIAQYMAAAAFFAVASTHLLVWSRRPDSRVHLLFALTALAAGGNAIAEACMYRAVNIDAMSVALKWYVAMAGLWLVALAWFFSLYTRVGTVGRWLAVGVSGVFLAAWVGNFFMPHSFLYTEIRGLREISLPWGEQIRLAVGRDNPWRMATELSILGFLALVIAGCLSLRRQGQRVRAWLIGASTVMFVLLFGTHAFLVDTGRLASPYLSSYGFLAIALVMSYDLAGEVVRAAVLSTQLVQKEADLRTAVDEERSRIARELHDSVTQILFSTAAIADALPDVWERYPEEARGGLEDLRRLTKGALAEMRSLLLELRPAALLEKSLAELLSQLADAMLGRSRIEVTVDAVTAGDGRSEPGDCPLPEHVRLALYRVAQEALNNVVKHARARSVTVRLSCQSEQVRLVITDDGQGFDPLVVAPARLGLKIMRERVHALGGRINLVSQPGAGTTVEVVWSDRSRGDGDG